MIDILKLGIYQFNIVWEDVIANRQKIEKLLGSLKPIPDMIILPEMFTTGFTMRPFGINSKLIDEHFDWQMNLSERYQVALMGSVIASEKNHFKNRLIYTQADRKTEFYDKRHLFFIEKESGFYIAGNERKIIEFNNIKIMPQICYDLRFPVWSRNNVDYQVLVYVSNWPANRQKVWETLLPARAIENQCYVVGVNRVGEDGNNISYKGGSTVINPKGESVLVMGDQEGYSEISISMKELSGFREKFPVYKDADSFTIQSE